MKKYTNEINIKNETNIMSTNSMRNAGTTAAPLPGHRLPKCKTLLWLALPFTLGVGCAFGPGSSAFAGEFFTDFPAPVVAPVSQSEAANGVIEGGIFHVLLADTSTGQSMGVSVKAGVATVIMWPTAREWIWKYGSSVDGSFDVSFNVVERQLIVDQVWGLAGVNQVKGELGVDLAPTSKVIAAH
jgi:hypothetical protein